MNGSEKQIIWAEQIKAEKAAELAAKNITNPVMKKGIEFLMSIDSAEFWIDFKEMSSVAMVMDLFKGGLFLRGRNFSDCVKMEQKTGEIVKFNK